MVLERELENMTYLFEFVPCFTLPEMCGCTCTCMYRAIISYIVQSKCFEDIINRERPHPRLLPHLVRRSNKSLSRPNYSVL